jgi:ribonucleoside-diphosphate reductase alpha chain
MSYKKYTKEEVGKFTAEYYNHEDDLAVNVNVGKYLLRDLEGLYLEKTPDDMHRRMASVFAEKEAFYGGPNALEEDLIYHYFKDFRYIVPQGSCMYGVGNNFQKVSVSNCVVIDSPEDNISSIFDTARSFANLSKRRCVSGNTFVSTKGGLKKMRDVKIGDEVLSYNLETRKSEFKKVLDKFDTEVNVSDRVVIQTSDGAQLHTSTKHPVLTFDAKTGTYKYVDAGKLSVGDTLIRPERGDFVSENIPEDLAEKAWFIGHHMGDGSCDVITRPYNKNYTAIRFRCAGDNEEVIEEYTRIFNLLSGSNSNYHVSNRKDYVSTVWEYANIANANKGIAEEYLDNQIGSKTYTGFIPSYVKKNNLYLPFFAGLFDADGWVRSGGSLDISLCAKDIIDELAVWLKSQGVRCNVGTYIPKKTNEAVMYRLTVHYNEHFMKSFVPFMKHPKKKQFLLDYKNVDHSSKYSLSPCEINSICEKFEDYKKFSGDTITTVGNSLRRGATSGLGEAGLVKFTEAGLISPDKFLEITQRVSIVSIEASTEEDFYDIEVEDNNNFFAGNYGLVNIHNCGVGMDLSKLRPEGMSVKNSAGSTSGAWSFADYFSYVCRMIGQSGRRAALMLTMDVRHPDIFSFVKCKHDSRKVTGANISVKLSDDFMNAVRQDEDFVLQWPVDVPDPSYTRTIRARELWEDIVESATKTADPGLLMWDNIIRTLPAHCYPFFKTISTNPCSELSLSGQDSCRLISLNLKHLVENPFTSQAYFNHEKFSQIVKDGQRLMDDLVSIEIDKLTEIESVCDTEDERLLWSKLREACERGRRTGLGTHGLADALARMCVRYDSIEGIAITKSIFKNLRDSAYRSSVEMAKERGAFPDFDWELEKDNEFIQALPIDIINDMKVFGRRNISILTNAPTGSVSICSQTSSGVEPVFRNRYKRRRKLSHNENHIPADFVDELGDRWQEYIVNHHNVKEYLALNNLPDDAPLPDFFVESDGIDWERRLDVQQAMQIHIDHSISSTINLPKGTSSDTVGDLYMKAWEKGLKGVTVYVDGSKSGVLLDANEPSEKAHDSLLELLKSRDIVPEHAEITEDGVIVRDVYLPNEFDNGPTQKVKADGHKYYMHLSYLKGDTKFPVAFWVLTNKVRQGEYVTLKRAIKAVGELLIEKGVDLDLISDLLDKAKDDHYHAALGKLIGMCLRHNIHASHIVDSLTGIEGDYVASTVTAIRKFLTTYIEGAASSKGEKCLECGGEVRFEGGCNVCVDCGSGECG